MSNVFGQHELALPFRSTADILTGYAKRDPAKTAIVDLDQGTSITFGSLNQASIDVATDLKRRGVNHGDKVVVLSDEVLEKLVIWFAVAHWRGHLPTQCGAECRACRDAHQSDRSQGGPDP